MAGRANGVQFTLDGATFLSAGDEAMIIDDGQSIVANYSGRPGSVARALGVAELDAGEYPPELFAYSGNTSGGVISLKVLPGVIPWMETVPFSTLTTESKPIDFTLGRLQLVPEPTAAGLLVTAIVLSSGVWRRWPSAGRDKRQLANGGPS